MQLSSGRVNMVRYSLRAYYESALSERPFGDYQRFPCRVSGQAGSLVAVNDPREFHRKLERTFHDDSLSQDSEQRGRP